MTLGCHFSKENRRVPPRTWPKIRVVKHPASGAQSWQVDAGKLKGKRLRKNFLNLTDAKEFARLLQEQRRQHGKAAFDLSVSQREEAHQALELLKAFPDASLAKAVRFYVKHRSPANGHLLISELIEDLLAAKERENKRPQYLGDLRKRLTNFCTTVGDKNITEIAAAEIKEWLFGRTDLSKQSIHNNYRNLRVLINFALQGKFLSIDPLIGIKPPVLDQHVQILAVEQAGELLKQAAALKHLGLLPYVTFGLFCGVRTSELQQLTWENVNLGERLLTIPNTIAKKRRIRNIEIPFNCARWLKRTRLTKTKSIAPLNTENRFKELTRKSGIEPWPSNAMRHSFASYYYALTEDAAKTSARLGQRGDAVLFDHYRALATKRDAKKYFRLAPF